MINFRPLAYAKLKNKKRRLIYRSSELIKLNELEINLIVSKLSINVYIDLRTKDELLKKGKPDSLIEAGLIWKSFPIEDNNHYFRTKNNPSFYDYYDSYRCLLELNKGTIKALLEYLSLSFNKGCIFAFYAGKDRTCIIAIILLMFMKFSKIDIIVDYIESEKYLHKGIAYFKKNWLEKGLTKEAYKQRLTPHPNTVNLLIEYIFNTYGSIWGYLEDIELERKSYDEMLCALKQYYY